VPSRVSSKAPRRLPKLTVIPDPHAVVALPAVYRPVATGLKRHFRNGTALAANSPVHLPGTGSEIVAPLATALARFPGGPAIGTPGRFVGKTLFSEKFLLAGRKDKLFAAFFAGQGFVLIKHLTSPHKIVSLKLTGMYHTYQGYPRGDS
jgi:hypothetical protein